MSLAKEYHDHVKKCNECLYGSGTSLLNGGGGRGDADICISSQKVNEITRICNHAAAFITTLRTDKTAVKQSGVDAFNQLKTQLDEAHNHIRHMTIIRVTRQVLDKFKDLANKQPEKELGAQIYMNRATKMIDKFIIPKQQGTSTSWEEVEDTSQEVLDKIGTNHTWFGQIHSHVTSFTCFLSRTDIIMQHTSQKLQPEAIMIIYSKNCGNAGKNVEGNLGKVQLAQGKPGHDGFKAYRLTSEALETSPEVFMKGYDETESQNIYMPANWEVVEDGEGSTIIDLRSL
jgi:hypothetical protein